MPSFQPLHISSLLFAAGFTSRAPSPVWRDSTTREVKFRPMPRHEAVKLWHRARDYERQTRAPGRQDGALGRNGLAVLHSLIFDFLNHKTGQLDPSQKAIAKSANISVRSVGRGLQSLKLAGVLNWVRRCSGTYEGSRFVLKQDTNAYAVLPPSNWLTYVRAPSPPPPEAGTWGDHPCGMRSGLQEATASQRAGEGLAAVVRQLALDEGDELARTLARLGSAIAKREQQAANGGSIGLPA